MIGTLNRQLWLQTYDANKGVQYSIRVSTEHTIMGRLQLWAYVSTISYCESHYHIGIHWEYGTVLRNKKIFINQGNGLAYTKFLISAKDHPFYICMSCPLMRDESLWKSLFICEDQARRKTNYRVHNGCWMSRWNLSFFTSFLLLLHRWETSLVDWLHQWVSIPLASATGHWALMAIHSVWP